MNFIFIALECVFKALERTFNVLECAYHVLEYKNACLVAAEVVDEGVGVGVTVVSRMRLTEDRLPVAAVGEGEEGVGI